MAPLAFVFPLLLVPLPLALPPSFKRYRDAMPDCVGNVHSEFFGILFQFPVLSQRCAEMQAFSGHRSKTILSRMAIERPLNGLNWHISYTYGLGARTPSRHAQDAKPPRGNDTPLLLTVATGNEFHLFSHNLEHTACIHVTYTRNAHPPHKSCNERVTSGGLL